MMKNFFMVRALVFYGIASCVTHLSFLTIIEQMALNKNLTL
jgi:hypothetical protein